MENDVVTRRSFLKKSAAGASALALPAVAAGGVLGANEAAQIGVVGCGGRGSHDLRKLVTVPGVRIVSVCELRDDRLERARDIAKEFRPSYYKDFRKMIESEKLDGCTVVVEVQNHAKVVIPILEAGINCFTEKPMDTTVEKVDAMTLAARKSKGFLQVGFQRRYIPSHRAVIKSIHEQELGRIICLQGHWHFYHPAGPADADWDGGRLIEQACHHMDVMCWVMGNKAPLRCVAMGGPPLDVGPNPPAHMSEAKSSEVFEYPGNVIFSYTHFFGMPEPFASGTFADEKLWVVCEKGGYDITKGMKYPRGQEAVSLGKASTGFDDGTYEEFVSFVECCKTGKKPDSNQENGRIATFTSMLGRMAMYDRETRSFTPRVREWKDLGSSLG